MERTGREKELLETLKKFDRGDLASCEEVGREVREKIAALKEELRRMEMLAEELDREIDALSE